MDDKKSERMNTLDAGVVRGIERRKEDELVR